ncbi:hypothetical protein SAMN05443549_10351 [Flavobacterium fluvii]|uniref:Uncharacterized protein n=1 Tax=Flavobacterium fluvii TaxID=468056 RepID=A0A1M5IFQ2_9FLAO|nr:hypothetical protein SAMN05443549_10351 [Flavobacterium fluvii]
MIIIRFYPDAIPELCPQYIKPNYFKNDDK